MKGARPGRSTGDSGSGDVAAIGCGEKGDDEDESCCGEENATGDGCCNGCGCADAVPRGCSKKGDDVEIC